MRNEFPPTFQAIYPMRSQRSSPPTRLFRLLLRVGSIPDRCAVDWIPAFAGMTTRTIHARSTIYGCRWDTREVKAVAACASGLIHCVSTDTPLDADSP